MLDQSFAATNFRKIIDVENRKGNYLEGEFFPDVEERNKEIQTAKIKLRTLKLEKSKCSEEEYEAKKRLASS